MIKHSNQPNAPEARLEKPVDQALYTEEYFLTACEGYDEFVRTEGENLSRRLTSAFALAAVSPGMKILDVGCGRGEILRHCAKLGADAYGIDYAVAAVRLSQDIVRNTSGAAGKTGVAQSDAKKLPFPNSAFDRVLLFDVVEHLHDWELHQALLEIHRVLKPDGKLIVHTAPNVWYDRYAYPLVRAFRRLIGQGKLYPKNPRAFLVDVNQDVHVNEQSLISMSRVLGRAGFKAKVWLDSPPQKRQNPLILDIVRQALFKTVPFRWFLSAKCSQ